MVARVEEPESADLVVLGGGICGLAAAEEATRLGASVVVVEKDDTVGGLLRTDRREGFCFDRGGHRFITSVPWVLDRVTQLLGERLLVRERNSFVFLDGTRVAYPLDLHDLVERLGWKKNVRALGSYLWSAWRHRRRPETTLEDWLRRRFGDYLYGAVFEGYSEKLWGVHPRQISAEWAPQRISIPHLGGFLRELVVPSRRPPRTYARRYLYPRTGIGEIADAFRDAAIDGGARLWTNSRAQSIARTASGWEFELSTPDGVRTLHAPRLLSTIPLPALASAVVSPTFPPLPTLSFRGLRFLNLAFDHEIPVDATWIYHPDRRSRFTRVQVPAARSPWMVPEGCGSVQLEEPIHLEKPRHVNLESADDRPSTWEAGIEDARETIRATLGVDSEPRFAFEVEEPCAYPVYRPGVREAVADWVRHVERDPTLRTAGRQGSFSYLFFDRAIVEGVQAGRALLGAPPLAGPTEDTRPVPIEAASIAGAERRRRSTSAGSRNYTQ